jgi:hypothetical protein
MFWTNFPVYIQAVTAILTLFIVIATFKTQGKIKTLTDVVVELQRQTKILSDRFDLERTISVRHRFPDFEVTDFYSNQDARLNIELTNRGQFATHFETKTESNTIAKILIGDYQNIGESKILHLFVVPNPIQTEMKKYNFSFTLSYKNGYGYFLTQEIICNDGNIYIVPQTDKI